jgi:hypothetical protein
MQWMRLSNGREELIVNRDHVKRLLGEGAVPIDDPRVSQEPEKPKELEQLQGSAELNADSSEGTEQPSQEGLADGSTNDNVRSDSTSQDDDQRHGNTTAVQRSRRTK